MPKKPKNKTPKQGRPSLPREYRRDRLVCFRLTEREKQILDDYSWRYGVSPSTTIRDCLEILGVIPSWS